MQHEDPVLSPIIQKIEQNDVSPQVSNYFINGGGLLCHLSKHPSRSPRSNTIRKKVCIPHCLQARILESVHSEYGGHLNFFKTYHRLSENFFWQNMYKDTKNFVRSCTVCLSRQNAFKIPPAPHQPVEQSQKPGETCHIDIFGPLKTTPKGNSYVLSMIDAFTKCIHIIPFPDIKSSTISKAFFDNYIVHRGCPRKLVVDSATYFKSSEFVEFCRVMGIQKRHISSYSAHVNGRVEKPNQSLANILSSISQNTNDWDEQLPHTMLALNSAIHEATYTSPFFLEHGRDIRLSYTYEKNSDTPQNKYEYVEKLLPSLERIFNKVLNYLKEKEASHVDLSTRATKQHHYDYKIGSLCFIKTPNIKSNLSPKLRPKFEGPYRYLELFEILKCKENNPSHASRCPFIPVNSARELFVGILPPRAPRPKGRTLVVSWNSACWLLLFAGTPPLRECHGPVMRVGGLCLESTAEVKWGQVFLFHTGFGFMTNMVSLGDKIFFYCSLHGTSAFAGIYRNKDIFPHRGRVADFFGGVIPPERLTFFAVSMHQLLLLAWERVTLFGGVKRRIHQIPFVVNNNRADVKITVATLGTGDLPSRVKRRRLKTGCTPIWGDTDIDRDRLSRSRP
ncbi:gypsy retrotransposon integrase-like protein 1 [Trichonephila clavipes]|nr:gypsy retrotransposon integrase-like protein 1 [Trichonephila clavipes]